MRISLDGAWTLYYQEHNKIGCADFSTANELKAGGFANVPATVPGDYEIDLERAGVIDDIFFGENCLEAQKRENLHLWYTRSFSAAETADWELVFEGIDTYAEIFLNGRKLGKTENMFIQHRFSAPLLPGENEIVVHILPAMIEARKYPVTAGVIHHQEYNAGGLMTRKAQHMYGWDIMPRILSGGLWRSVFLQKKKTECIADHYLRTVRIGEKNASLRFYYEVEVAGDLIQEYILKLTGICKDSFFEKKIRLWHTSGNIPLDIQNPYLWWTKDMGEPNLYDVTLELFRGAELLDVQKTTLGVRTFRLERTSLAGENGKFCFYINEKPLFVRGTNWVPLDALHSRDAERLPKALELLDDSGCNMVRCWGGNVYEDTPFFDFCDRHGIAIWQDFAMGCAVYPQGEPLCSLLREEVTAVVKKLRHHACIALWAGDNECDEAAASWTACGQDPNKNVLTRKIIPEVLQQHDTERIYLPSSPYIDEEAYRKNKDNAPEKHLWGPRDYFKSDFYTKAPAIFASETGYHGCPAPSSVEKFIDKEHLWPMNNNRQWLAHAACMEAEEGATYSYRLPLMASQIDVLFGEQPDNLQRFAITSQASQAEAMKFFIERFRSAKWERTGIIWWNLLDGWPQFSDAVTDYYFRKKLAYYVIKRAQQPLGMLFREPEDGKLTLVGANEYARDITADYTVKDMTNGKIVVGGNCIFPGNSAIEITSVPFETDGMHFYLIEWNADGKLWRNHYVSGTAPYNFDVYYDCMCRSGLWQMDE